MYCDAGDQGGACLVQRSSVMPAQLVPLCTQKEVCLTYYLQRIHARYLSG